MNKYKIYLATKDDLYVETEEDLLEQFAKSWDMTRALKFEGMSINKQHIVYIQKSKSKNGVVKPPTPQDIEKEKQLEKEKRLSNPEEILSKYKKKSK